MPAAEFRTAYEKAVDGIGRTVQIPGFRKGKAPRAVLERKFGAALHEDALNTIVGETVKSILDDEADGTGGTGGTGGTLAKTDRPLPYSSPEIDGDFPAFDLDKDLSFAVKWDVAPEVVVKEWTGFTAEVANVSVGEEDIGRELEIVRDRNAVVIDRPEGEAVRNGDIVTVDYAELDDAGKPVAGKQREGFVFTAGSKSNIYELDDAVIGMKAGEEKRVEKVFPADFENPDLAGQSRTILLKVTYIKEKKLPDLDDELAQDVDEKYKTLDDLKRSIRERLEGRLEKRLLERRVSAVLEQVMLKNPVEVPESMVMVQVESRLRQMGRMYGLSDAAVMNFFHTKKGGLEQWRTEEERRLHAALIEEKLIAQLNIEVSEQDREESFAEQVDAEPAARAGGGAGGDANDDARAASIKELREYYAADDRRSSLDDFLKTKKLEDLLLRENTVKPGAKQTFIEFMGDEA